MPLTAGRGFDDVLLAMHKLIARFAVLDWRLCGQGAFRTAFARMCMTSLLMFGMFLMMG